MSCLKSCFTNPDLNKKLMWAGLSAAIFVGVSLPQTYNLTKQYRLTTVDNCPTGEGKLIHAGLFFALNFLAMKAAARYKWNGLDTHSDRELAQYAAYGTLLFFVLISTDVFNVTHSILGNTITDPGCPTQMGVFVHAVVYMVVLVVLMYFK